MCARSPDAVPFKRIRYDGCGIFRTDLHPGSVANSWRLVYERIIG